LFTGINFLPKKNITIIGAGKIAFSLTSALIQAEYPVKSIISRNLKSAKELATKFSIPHYSASISKFPEEVETYFITVPDGEIKKVADKLAKTKRSFKNTVCIHFSGVENIKALNSLAKKECAVGSLHIIRPFPSKDIVELKNYPASVETESKLASKFLMDLCRKLQLKPHRINSDAKVFHHMAAVHSSNFLVGNLFNAFSLIDSKNNLPKDILRQTTQTALENVFRLTPAKALSGPIDRGDIYAIKKHLEALDIRIRKAKYKGDWKLLKDSYIIQSLGLLEVVKKKYGKLSANHLKIKKLLKSKID
jgi:predicted short-subunit dehydrogenase-like oxidoreductase (DUF2520 family)